MKFLFLIWLLMQPFETTPVFDWNWNAKSRVVINQGGTGSSKTYSICQVLLCRALAEPLSVTTIVGQDIPNLKSGPIRDMGNIIAGLPDILRGRIGEFHVQDKQYVTDQGAVIEFRSYDNAQDAKSGKRTRLFVNEANGVPRDVVFELRTRTTGQIFFDYNPDCRFWMHDEYLENPDMTQGVDYDFFISNYTHNPFTSGAIMKDLERLKESDPEVHKSRALGITANITGLVFPNVEVVDEFPEDVETTYGLDFGFTNDPAVLIRSCEYDGRLVFDQMLYARGLTNQDLSDAMTGLGIPSGATIYADAAEPKSIEELRCAGWWIQPSIKGADAVRYRIDWLKQHKLAITKRSTNWLKEHRTYTWAKDRWTGQYSGKPIDGNDHGWDAAAYAWTGRMGVADAPNVGVISL